MGSFKFSVAEEVSEVWWPVVSNNQPFEAARDTEVDICKLLEGRCCTRVVQYLSEGLLDRTGGGFCQVEGHM